MRLDFSGSEEEKKAGKFYVTVSGVTAEEVYYPLQASLKEVLAKSDLGKNASLGFENSVEGNNPRISVQLENYFCESSGQQRESNARKVDATMNLLRSKETIIIGDVSSYAHSQEALARQAEKAKYGFVERLAARLGASPQR